jgi:hypothetical protein
VSSVRPRLGPASYGSQQAPHAPGVATGADHEGAVGPAGQPREHSVRLGAQDGAAAGARLEAHDQRVRREVVAASSTNAVPGSAIVTRKPGKVEPTVSGRGPVAAGGWHRTARA